MRTFGSGSQAGQPCEAITSLPFGDGQATQQLNGGCGDPSPNHFTGKERDSESGQDYFDARYYSSSLGRFLSVDPGPYSLENPQTLNRYSYVNNNPLKFVDPSGKFAEYVVDWKHHIIVIKVSVTIWGPGANQQYATRLKTAIESAWKGTYTDPKTGMVFKISTQASVTVYDALRGQGLNARNGFYVGPDVSRSNFHNEHVDPRWGARYPGDPGIYTGALNPDKDDEKHESGHMIGEPDDYWEDPIAGHYGPQPGHEGHLMAGAHSPHAAQDELNRIGSYVLDQSRTTGRSQGTIIQLPEPKNPR